MVERTQPDPQSQPRLARLRERIEPLVKPRWGPFDYAYFLIKNIIGWALIGGALIAGPLVPGPGGLPMFLIGFALITFPGKRRLTARVLRGIPVRREGRAYRMTVALVSILVPAGIVSYFVGKWFPIEDPGINPIHWSENRLKAALIVGYFVSVAAIWIFLIRGVDAVNMGLRLIARARRRIRPWLRKHGLDLLPPRRRRRLLQHGAVDEPDEEILEIHQRHRRRLQALWQAARPWLLHLLRAAVVLGIFTWMLRPVFQQWEQVRGPILSTNWMHFALAALMFALFLFVFRAMAWRRILQGLGHRLSVAAAARVWSLSELARYLPGAIWQVVGRVYLTRPYGVSGAVSSASQILELALFLLANILLALTCLLGAGLRRIPPDQRHWVFLAAGFVPVLLVLLHPKVFYGLLNGLLRKLGKPPILQRLPKRMLAAIVGWNMLGLLWQAAALFILTYSVLGLSLDKWYVVAGAYCLAWTIGFTLGFLSPGGLGVREAVFITTMQVAFSPAWVAQHLSLEDPALFRAFLGFLGVLLRLWAMAGELLMAGAALMADRRRPSPRPPEAVVAGLSAQQQQAGP